MLNRFFTAAANSTANTQESCSDIECAWPVIVLYGALLTGMAGALVVSCYLQRRQEKNIVRFDDDESVPYQRFNM